MNTFTIEGLELFKKQFPEDEAIQKVSFEELVKLNGGTSVNWDLVEKQNLANADVMSSVELEVSECQLSIGYVVIDVICLAIGGVGLRSSFNRYTAQTVIRAAQPAIAPIGRIIAEITRDGASIFQKAKAVFSVLSALYSAGCLGAVVKAFLSNLKWYQMIIYGATSLATIMAAVLTDGAALIAEIVILLGSFTWLTLDSVQAIKACNL